MSRETAVLLTLIVYKVILIGIGIAASRWNRDRADFFLGGRRLGGLVAAISASASSSSAWTLLGVSGAAYSWGLGAIWIFPACLGGFCLNWFVLAPRLRRVSRNQDALTVTELLAKPDGRSRNSGLAWLGSIIIAFSLTFYVASQLQASGKTFSSTFGLGAVESISIGAVIIVFYTMVGGFWAVSLTDTLQGLVMAGTSLILPIVALVEVGGVGALWNGMGEVQVEGFTSLFRTFPLAAGIWFAFGLFGIGIGYPGQPHVVNRFMALRDDSALSRGRVIAIVWAFVVYSGMILLGWCGRVLIPVLDDQETVFFSAANALFPPVVGGVMVAGVLSAIMSTADSQLLVASSSVSYDLAGERSSSGQRSLLRSRLVVLGLSGAAVLLALVGTQEIFSPVLFAWSAMGAAFGPLLLVTVIRGPVSPRWSFAAMACGFFLSVVAYSLPATKGTAVERWVPFLVALFCAMAGRSRRRVSLEVGSAT